MLFESPQKFLAAIRNTVENREFAKHAAADLLGLHYIIDTQYKKPNFSTIRAMAMESDEETRARINKALAGIDKAELEKFIAAFGNHNYGQVRDMVIRAERRLQYVYDEFELFKHLQQ